MAKRDEQRISLDEVAAGKLPKRVLDQIEKVELTVEELVEWEKSKPPFKLVLTDRQLDFMVRKRVRWNSKSAKIVTIIAAIVGSIWTYLGYLHPLINGLIS